MKCKQLKKITKYLQNLNICIRLKEENLIACFRVYCGIFLPSVGGFITRTFFVHVQVLRRWRLNRIT